MANENKPSGSAPSPDLKETGKLDLTDSGHVLALWIGLHALAPH